MSLLEVDHLSVRFGVDTAVDDVSFTLDRGQRVAVIGESGSGKSMTALAIMGLLPEGATAAGSVRFDGSGVLGASDRALSRLRGDRVAIVFQNPQSSLNPLMRVGAQIAEPLRLHRRHDRRRAARAAIDWCARVGLPDPERIARAYPHQLSGGQRQRVGLAMALACEPDLLIADEPTTALDVTVQAEVLAVLDRLVVETGAALLFITHDLALVQQVCDDLLVMRSGQIVDRGRAADVLTGRGHEYTRALLDAARLTAVPGAVDTDAGV